jgi:serine/threonine-protein kinase
MSFQDPRRSPPTEVGAAVDPLIGQVLCRRFEIVAPIAAGGMGQVYRAIQRPLERQVALKVLNPGFDASRDPAFEERFFFEALMTAKLRHPNTVMLLDYGRSDEGLYFMALELLEGETLQQLLVRCGPLPWPRALAIGAQVARALREAHRLGLVHRDLKPGNIMVSDEGPLGDRVKVLDFGLVKCVESLAETARKDSLELTEAGIVLGSPLYMAPEQAKKAVDLRSDIYSLGAVLFAAVAGRTPFLGKKPFELLFKHMHEEPPRLASLADVPDDVDALVMKCLAKAPEQRFQTMDELILAVHQVVRAHELGGLFVEIAKRPTPTPTLRPTPAARPRSPPPLPAKARVRARDPRMPQPVRGAALALRAALASMGRRTRRLAWSALFGLGLVALVCVLASSSSSSDSVDSAISTSADAPGRHAAKVTAREPMPAEEGPSRRLDVLPWRSAAPLPRRQRSIRRAADQLTAPSKPSAPSTLRGFRSDPYE